VTAILETIVLPASEPRNVELAGAKLREGGLVAFPTETVYGLGADATDPRAVARIFEAKRRPRFDPLIVHVAEPEQAARYGSLSDRRAAALVERFWPGPLTLVVPRRETVPAIVTAGLDTVALRCPAHSIARALIRAAERPVAAPSANLFGSVSPTEAEHVREQLWGRIDLILDGGRCGVGVESTIVSLCDPPKLLRAGGVPVEELETLLGPLERATQAAARQESPGQLAAHYATRTRLVIAAQSAAVAPPERVGLLAFTAPERPESYAAVEVLSRRGDLGEAAANLFSALHRLDRLGLDRIVALAVPEEGLGVAIMDRLRRCAAGSGRRPG
jgi:L-threonylcarbamoyladenylate synthase